MTSIKKSFLFALALASSPLYASTSIPWPEKSTFQFAHDIELQELLRGFASLQKINAVIDPDIKGTVNGTFSDIPPEEMLDRISRAYSLSWFYDGNILYITPSQKTESKVIEINSLAAVKLLDTISNLGIIAPSSSIRVLGSGGIAFVSGPPKYVEIVEDLAKRMSSNLQVTFTTAPKIKIFELKYAWAYDTSFKTQESSIKIPGVATVLRGLMDPSLSQDAVISGQTSTSNYPIAPNVTTYIDRIGPERYNNDLVTDNKAAKDRTEEDKKDKDKNKPKTDQQPTKVAGLGATLIQPDIRLNAIIVRDVEEKMHQYEQIIKALDVPVKIIEIAVTIMDVNTNYSSNIGNQFLQGTSIKDSSKNFSVTSGGDNSSQLTKGFNFTGNAVVDGYKIVSQIQALASDGHANVVARPSVLTLNNLEAEISKAQTFYAALTGNNNSNLANVTVATKLKVTPCVINSDDSLEANQIKLMVSIDDGSINTGTIVGGTYPTTSNDSIYTQAVINEGQSLLIGGYYKQTESETETGIPLLRHIPILGYLFKSKNKTKSTLERMYLITPRIIDLAYETGPNIASKIAKLEEPTYGIAHEAAAKNFRIRQKIKRKHAYQGSVDCATYQDPCFN